jgi:protein involved in polysaccharide export with SLBB domain
MNRVLRMIASSLSVCLLCLGLMACEQQTPASVQSTPAPPAEYLISGGVSNPGPRTLASGDCVATVIARNIPPSPGQPMTIVLIRRAPEGKTRQLIQLDARGQLMDQKQNVALRNGDELVFPGGKTTDPTGNPQRGPG